MLFRSDAKLAQADAATLASAQSYCDGMCAQAQTAALAAAQRYCDGKPIVDLAALQAVRQYVDDRCSEVLGCAKAYVDDRPPAPAPVPTPAPVASSVAIEAKVSESAPYGRIWQDMKSYIDYRTSQLQDQIAGIRNMQARDVWIPQTSFGRFESPK